MSNDMIISNFEKSRPGMINLIVQVPCLGEWCRDACQFLDMQER